jgi:energy-coupling factor transport system substrate-specific component
MFALFQNKPFFRNLVIVITGALLYGLLNKLMSGLLLPGAEFITIRPQLIIPVVISLLLGPFAGGFIGLFGNLFGDMLSGYGLQFWPWSIANFLIGFVPGIVRWMGVSNIKRVNEFALVLLFIFLGNMLGLFEGFVVYALFNGQPFGVVINTFYLPALISNFYLLMLLMPPSLALAKFLTMNIETRSMFFVLLFSMIIVTLLSVVFMVVEYRLVANLPDSKTVLPSMVAALFRWIGVMLILIVAAAGVVGFYFSRKYMHPINQLAEVSDKLKEGNWNETDTIEKLKAGNDMQNLIGIFNDMAHEIQIREKRMKNTIRELELKIDREKEDRMVSEITETDFFKQLEIKSAELRKRK